MSNIKYRPEIDGLRAVAVMPVILFHAGFPGFSGGYVGVDIFFVISGYLITLILLSDNENKKVFRLVDFYERRARRILPAFFFVLFLTTVAVMFYSFPTEYKSYSKALLSTLIFSSNVYFYFSSGYFDQSSELNPLLHTWSLSVEEQFYIFFPLLLLYLLRKGGGILLYVTLFLLAVISFFLSVVLIRYDVNANFYLLPTRAWELLVGTGVALIEFKRVVLADKYQRLLVFVGLIGMCLVIYSIVAFDKKSHVPGVHALFPVFGAAMIVIGAKRGNLVGWVLGSMPLVRIGLISYSAYLIHQPLFAVARMISLDHLTPLEHAPLILATIILAYLVWRFVENPFRNKSKITLQFIVRGSVSASLLFVVVGVYGVVSAGWGGRFEPETLSLLNHSKIDYTRQIKCEDLVASYPDVNSACVIHDEGQVEGSKVAVWGDSHARSIVWQVAERFNNDGISVLNLATSGCPGIADIYRKSVTAESVLCRKFKDSVVAHLMEPNSPKVVVLLSRWTINIEDTRFDNGQGGVEYGSNVDWYAPRFVADDDHNGVLGALRNTIDGLLSSGKYIVLVYPIPEAGWTVPLYMARASVLRKELSNYQLSTSYELYKKRHEKVISLFDSYSGDKVFKVRPSDILCNEGGRCLVARYGAPLYDDNNHPSAVLSELIADQVYDVVRHKVIADN